MKKEGVVVIAGSRSDDERTKEFLRILKECRVGYRTLVASAHVYAGQAFVDFVENIPERIIVFIGGMSLVAPGIISGIRRNMGRFDSMVFGVPTDSEARSAVEVLPLGTFVLTAGLNTINLTHGIKNNALAVAHFVLMVTGDKDISEGLTAWYAKLKAKKPMEEIDLDGEGFIPEREKK